MRLAWVIPSTYVFRSLGRLIRGSHEPLPSWQSVLFVAWAGLRGGDSLVLALALPLQTASGARFPAREQIIFITFCVIFITLVVQGPTLAPLLRRLGLSVEASDEAAEESHARLAVAEAGLRKLEEPAIATSPYPEVVRYLRQRHRQRARRWAAARRSLTKPRPGTSPMTTLSSRPRTRRARSTSIAPRSIAAFVRRCSPPNRTTVLELRDDGVIADDVMRRIQRDLDLETMLLETSEPVSETVSDVPSAIDAASR